jgi:hypothetical protein
MKTKSLRHQVTLWIVAAVMLASLVSFASPVTDVFAGDCVPTQCSGG